MKRFVCTLLEETEERTPLRHFPGKFASGEKAPGGFYFKLTSSKSTLILTNLGEN